MSHIWWLLLHICSIVYYNRVSENHMSMTRFTNMHWCLHSISLTNFGICFMTNLKSVVSNLAGVSLGHVWRKKIVSKYFWWTYISEILWRLYEKILPPRQNPHNKRRGIPRVNLVTTFSTGNKKKFFQCDFYAHIKTFWLNQKNLKRFKVKNRKLYGRTQIFAIFGKNYSWQTGRLLRNIKGLIKFMHNRINIC